MKSGDLHVRLPRSLHEALAERATQEGTTITNVAVGLIASGLGWRPGTVLMEVPMISSGQKAAFHAKCNALDQARGVLRGTSKPAAYIWASERFGREVKTSLILTFDEMSELLDHLDTEFGAVARTADDGA